MIRVSYYLRDDQHTFLKKLGGQISDHIRQAIDDYIYKIKSVKASESRSKRGDEDDK